MPLATYPHYSDFTTRFTDPRESYRTLWQTLHDKPGERWDDDPWVVAVSFDVRQGNIDQVPA